MGLKTMIYVWSTPYSGSKKLMLMAIADNADEDTGIAFPGVETLAAKCGIKARAAQALITDLERSGELVVFVGKGTKTAHGWTNLYYMKKYREGIGLTTPRVPSRVDQITPKGMQKTASLSKGVQDSASQGVNLSASQGVQNIAPKHAVKHAVKQKEKESPDLLPLDDLSPDSPIGDVFQDDNLISNGETLIANAFTEPEAVKVDSEDSQPLTETPESAAPKRERKPRAALAAPQPPVGEPVPSEKPKPASKPKERNPLIEATRYAFNGIAYPYAAKWSQWFLGELVKDPKTKSDEYVAWQPEKSEDPTRMPAMILAFTLWYSRHKSYQDAYAKSTSLPRTPQTVRDKWNEFMASWTTDERMEPYWLPRGQELLDQLMRGEKVIPKTYASQSPNTQTKATESAGAYKTYDRSKDTRIVDDAGVADLANELLSQIGANHG